MSNRLFVLSLLSFFLASPSFAGDGVQVTFDSDKADVTIAVVEGNAVASGTYGTASATYYKDLCIAPCTVEIEPGLHRFIGYGKKYAPVAEKIEVRAGDEVHVQVKPAPRIPRYVGAYLASIGVAGMATAATFLAMEADPMLATGNTELLWAGTGLGIASTVGGVALLRATRGGMEHTEQRRGGSTPTVAVSGRF